jgi:hypothetical protein
VFILYLAAGGTACLAALFDRTHTGNAVIGAFRETFLANLPLFLIARGLKRATVFEIPFAPRWIIGAAIGFVVFAFSMGRGLRF